MRIALQEKNMKNERVIVWRITQDCNSGCKFCSYARDVDRKRENADPAQIRDFIKILGEYKEKTKRDVLVSWIGGEPFLYRDIMELSKELASRNLGVSVTTNGVLLQEKDLTDISEYFTEIVFSIDSFEECNDEVRGLKGHFKRVSECIKRLNEIRLEKRSKLKIKVNTILMRGNIDDFKAFCLYLKQIGVDEVTFNRLGGFDRPEFYSDHSLLPEQSRAFCNDFTRLRSELEESGIVIHGSRKYMDRFLTAAENIPNPIEECDPGSWFWFINENGYISPCSYTTYEYMVPISDIKSWDTIDKVEERFRKFRETQRSKWCDDCFCTQVYDKFG